MSHLEVARRSDRAASPGMRSSRDSRDSSPLPSSVRDVLASGDARPLESGTRETMERRMGRDFSMVNVHDDGRAAESAREMGAAAYTIGNHIVFGAEMYRPSSREGRLLIAHELVHVIQQSRHYGPSTILGPVEEPLEHEADDLASISVAGRDVHVGPGTSAALVQRQPLPSVFTAAQPSPDLRLDLRTVERTLAESQRPIRKWLDAHVNDVKILSLDDAVGLVRRSVMEAAGMSPGAVAAAVNAWAADEGIVLPRLSAVPGRSGTLQPVPEAPKQATVGISPYGVGMVGLHLEINPVSEPDIATFLRPYKDRGIPVDDKLVRDVTVNYDLGIRELENLLRATGLAGGPESVHKAAVWIAKRLLTQTMTTSAQQLQPTDVERVAAETEKYTQALGVPQPSFLQSLSFGASLTLHFDFLGGR